MSDVFTLKPEHAKVLREMSWQWSDEYWGGPCVDGKRPFGFSIGVERDIAEAIGMEPEGEEDGEPCLTDEQEEACLALYGETLSALRVILDAATVKPGRYALDESGHYRKVGR